MDLDSVRFFRIGFVFYYLINAAKQNVTSNSIFFRIWIRFVNSLVFVLIRVVIRVLLFNKRCRTKCNQEFDFFLGFGYWQIFVLIRVVIRANWCSSISMSCLYYLITAGEGNVTGKGKIFLKNS